MQVILAWIVGGFVQVAGTIVGKVLLSLGLGYAVFSGVDLSLGWAKAQFLTGMAGLPLMAFQVAGLLKVGVCVSLLISALTTRLVMGGLTSGSLKLMVQK